MSARDYKIDWFKSSDSEGVSRLFREIYGDGYPVKIVYTPGEFADAVARQDYIAVVARSPEGNIVGFSAFYRSAPNPKLYEMGMGVVAVEYRGTAILWLLMCRLEKVASSLPDFEGFFGESVCNHILMQKASVVFKAFETAIEIDLMPSEAYEKEKSAVGRVSTLVSSRTLIPWPHAIYAPETYKEYLAYIYRTFDDSRTLKSSDKRLPADQATDLAVEFFEGSGVLRILVNQEGDDFERVLKEQERAVQKNSNSVIQVWVNLSRPWVGHCVEIMRSRGYFFCGTFSRWFGEDALLLEKINGRPNWEGIHLYTDRAKQILQFIRDDWERTQRNLI